MLLDTLVLLAVLQTPPTRPAVFLFDHAQEYIAADGINRFELKIDGGEWTDVGRLAAPSQTGAAAGFTTYQASVPALTLGPHTAQIRACNVTACSDPPLSLSFVISITPRSPANFRIGG